MLNINDMTKADFAAVPLREWDKETECDCFIVLPGDSKSIHDSGYRTMQFILCSKGEPICRVDCGSDVIHIEGIGGYGHKWLERYRTVPHLRPPVDWNIDCLPKSGLLRFFAGEGIIAGFGLSSFCVWAQSKKQAA